MNTTMQPLPPLRPSPAWVNPEAKVCTLSINRPDDIPARRLALSIALRWCRARGEYSRAAWLRYHVRYIAPL